MQNDVLIIENQENESDNDSDSDDDYMSEINYDVYLNLEVIDKFEMYDIVFKNLSSQHQLKKIKEHMLSNPSLMLRIYSNLDVKKNYHAFLKRSRFIIKRSI